MKAPHLLNLSNPRKVKNNLAGILDVVALERIEKEIETNVKGLLALSQHHYRFAIKQSGPNWRQRISRLYYAAYNSGRAVRLYISGEYSTSVQDHQKFYQLPNDFPKLGLYKNRLEILRADRNICDYDHISKPKDLGISTKDATELVKEFIADTKGYLESKGLTL
jgi:hypothetical protein